jgi:CHAT domain-containing protein
MFGRILADDDVEKLKVAGLGGVTSITLSALYQISGQHAQVLRICRLRERIAADEKERKSARECQVASLIGLKRFADAERMAIDDGLSLTPDSSRDRLVAVNRWVLIAVIAESQGERGTAKKAYEQVLTLATTSLTNNTTGEQSVSMSVDVAASYENLRRSQLEEARLQARLFLVRSAYHDQDRQEFERQFDALLSDASLFQDETKRSLLVLDVATSLERMGLRAKASSLAREAWRVAKADAGFRDRAEPLEDFSVNEAAANALGDERTQTLHVVGRMRLATVYRLSSRLDEAERLLEAAHSLALGYQLEVPSASTLVASVEQAQARLAHDRHDDVAALRLLRAARDRLRKAAAHERLSEVGRRHVSLDDELLAVGAGILAMRANEPAQIRNDVVSTNEVLGILADFSASRAERSARQAASSANVVDDGVRSLLNRQGLLADQLIDARGAFSSMVTRGGQSDARAAELLANLRRLLAELQQVGTEIERRTADSPLSSAVPDTTTLVGALRPGDVVWQWVFHPEGNVAVAITRDGVALARVAEPVKSIAGQAKLLAQASSLRNVDRLSQLRPYPENVARELYESLFGRLAPMLPGYDRWVLVPSLALDRLPWGALRRNDSAKRQSDRSSWLIESVAIGLAPSINSWLAISSRPPSKARQTLLAVGNPLNSGAVGTAQLQKRGSYVSLVGAQGTVEPRGDNDFASELEAVAKIFPVNTSTTLAGRSATKAAIASTVLKDYRVILFSTHGFLAGSVYDAMGPALELTAPQSFPRDRFLTAGEIARFNLDADLVFLSACDTSGSDGSTDAEGFSGLTSAFLLSGARAVVATLWPIETTATTTLTAAAMRDYVANPKRPFAFALRAAMLRALADPIAVRRHPAFWSGFVVVGT